jgi:hypothetical protein
MREKERKRERSILEINLISSNIYAQSVVGSK